MSDNDKINDIAETMMNAGVSVASHIGCDGEDILIASMRICIQLSMSGGCLKQDAEKMLGRLVAAMMEDLPERIVDMDA